MDRDTADYHAERIASWIWFSFSNWSCNRVYCYTFTYYYCDP